MPKKISASTAAIDALDAALAGKTKPSYRRNTRQKAHTAEPAHTIIQKLGGPRELGRCLGISGAAVTRWQTKKTKTDRRGADGIIPQERRAAILEVARQKRVRLAKSSFEQTTN